MRPTTGPWQQTIRNSHKVVSRVWSKRGTGDFIPVPLVAGEIVYDASSLSIRRASITVPLIGADGFKWDPGNNPLHPLAEYGQELLIYVGIQYPDSSLEFLSQGYYLINNTFTDEVAGTVSVQAGDLMQRMARSPILSNPYDSFSPLYTYTTVAGLLMWPSLRTNVASQPVILPVNYAAMTNKALAGNLDVRESGDRVEAIQALAETWPARVFVNDKRELTYLPPVTKPATLPDLIITGGQSNSTAVNRGRAGGSQRTYNRVTAIGVDPVTGKERARAVAQLAAGPLDVAGPYGYVSRWYTSPLLLNSLQAASTASKILADGSLLARSETIECSPNSAIELWDTVQITTPKLGTFKGLVVAITMPLTSAQGPMSLTITNDAE